MNSSHNILGNAVAVSNSKKTFLVSTMDDDLVSKVKKVCIKDAVTALNLWFSMNNSFNRASTVEESV
jgi:hypothetical protein